MSNVLPVQEQKRVWAAYRQRFISLGAQTFSILALIAIVTLAPSYVLLVLNHPESSVAKAQGTDKNDNTEAAKTQLLIATLLPTVAGTTSPMEVIAQALDGKPENISVTRISYANGDSKQKTIILGGVAQSREDINALRKELEAKGIYKSVNVPVGDLIGATGNQFTVTLVTNN
jgi:hypothetical protein